MGAGAPNERASDTTSLEAENQRLREQVTTLVRSETRLYALQKLLDGQRRINTMLVELGRRFHSGVSRAEIVDESCQFIVGGLNAEVGAILEGEPVDDGWQFRTVSQFGLPRDLSLGAALAFDETVEAALTEQGEFVWKELGQAPRCLAPIGFVEGALIALSADAPGSRQLLLAGNRGKLHVRSRFIERGIIDILANLGSLYAASLRANRLYAELREERNLLESKVRDRTEALQQALERVQLADRLKNEFLASVSHELRTPLNTIINVPEGVVDRMIEEATVADCEACGERFEIEPGETIEATTPCPACDKPALRPRKGQLFVGDPEELSSRLGDVAKCGHHLRHVIDDILDMAKLEAGRMRFHFEPLRLGELLDHVEALLRVTVSRTRFERGSLDAELECRLDKTRVAQVVLNLVSNALKFSEPPLEVVVEVGVAGGTLAFDVVDRGIGIDREHQDIIFDAFRQIDGSNTRRFGGSGLGLAITRRIVLAHGGTIRVESALGKGSRFRVELPLRTDGEGLDGP